jgi:hypothetical protein
MPAGQVERAVGRAPRGRSRGAAALLLGVLGLWGRGDEVSAQVFLTQEEALGLAFPPPATIERRTAFLEEAQLSRVRELAGSGVQIEQRVVSFYVGRRGGVLLGVAYFDAHTVRTVREIVMVVVEPAGTVDRIEVLSFLEPREYMASDPWIEQLYGRALTDDLAVDRGIVNLTGATLTSAALTSAARRVLALHEVIRPFDNPSEP